MRPFREKILAAFRTPPLVLALTLALTPALTSSAARASEPAVAVANPREPATFALGLTVGLGVRSDLVRSAGLDPFSTTDGVPQTALSVSYRLSGAEPSGLAVGFEWDHGELTSTARGTDTSLTIDRLSLGLEGRIPLAARLVAFGRLAPGLLRDHASLLDLSAPAGAYGGIASGVLDQTTWVLAGDVSGGLAYRMAELHGQSGLAFGIWLAAEGGYGYAASHDLVLGPHVETQPGRVDEPLRLGTLAFHGAFLRVRLALSF
jgi:hypothetical protein